MPNSHVAEPAHQATPADCTSHTSPFATLPDFSRDPHGLMGVDEGPSGGRWRGDVLQDMGGERWGDQRRESGARRVRAQLTGPRAWLGAKSLEDQCAPGRCSERLWEVGRLWA